MNNGEAEKEPPKVAPPPAQQVTLDNINGRLSELTELNAALTARCAAMRGDMFDKDREISRLTQENMIYRQREEEAAKNTSLAAKPAKGKPPPSRDH